MDGAARDGSVSERMAQTRMMAQGRSGDPVQWYDRQEEESNTESHARRTFSSSLAPIRPVHLPDSHHPASLRCSVSWVELASLGYPGSKATELPSLGFSSVASLL